MYEYIIITIIIIIAIYKLNLIESLEFQFKSMSVKNPQQHFSNVS